MTRGRAGAAAALARDAAPAAALCALLFAARALAGAALPEPARLWGAWLALLVLPALAFALPHRATRGALDAAAIGAGESLALFSILAFAVALGGGGLRLAMLLHPIAAAAWLVASHARLRRGGARAHESGPGDSAATAGAIESRGGGAPATAGAALFAGLVLIGLARTPPPDFRMDVYDHAGAAARMADRDRILSRELGNGAESAKSDPRKGTWNAALAAALVISDAKPLAMWRSATIVAAILGALAFVRLSREALGRAWPLGAVFLLVAHEGGPAGAWLARSAYPGVLALFLYALFLAETLAAVRGRRAMPYELAAALGLLHLMAGLLGALAAAALGIVIALRRWRARARAATAAGADDATMGAAPADGWGLPPARSALPRRLAALAGVAGLACAVRVAVAGASASPIHTELQGILTLGGGLMMIEPRTLLERTGAMGALGAIAAFFLIGQARRDLATAWVIALTAIAAVLVSPFGTTLLAPHLSYLLRRLPSLAPLPLLAAVAAASVWATLRTRAPRAASGRRLLALAAGGVLLAAPLAAILDATTLVAAGNRPPLRDDAREAAWSADLERIAARLGRADRVATDPITGYALYARSLASPLALPDQHGPPNDGEAGLRLATLARILSTASAPDQRLLSAIDAGATHILVNEAFPATIPTLGYPVSPEELASLREILDDDSTRVRLAERAGPLSLYEIAPRSPRAIASRLPEPFCDPPNDAAEPGDTTSCGLLLRSASLSAAEIAPGELLLADCTLENPMPAPPVGDYAAFFSIAKERGDSPAPLAKVARAIGKMRGDRPDRVVFERITGARKPVIIWCAGEVVVERYGLRLPAGFEPGRYLVAMDVHRVPFFQNRSLAGLLGDRDEYSRIPIGSIEVVAARAGS